MATVSSYKKKYDAREKYYKQIGRYFHFIKTTNNEKNVELSTRKILKNSQILLKVKQNETFNDEN